jgi:hypothetical protein
MRERVVLIEVLAGLEDFRKPSNVTQHEFWEFLVMTITAVLADRGRMEEVVEWLRAQENWLRQSIALKKGIPLFFADLSLA